MADEEFSMFCCGNNVFSVSRSTMTSVSRNVSKERIKDFKGTGMDPGRSPDTDDRSALESACINRVNALLMVAFLRSDMLFT